MDGLELLDDENDALADAIAAGLGLTRVGWIFTDIHIDAELTAPANVQFNRDMTDTTTVFTAGELLQAAYVGMYRCPVHLSSIYLRNMYNFLILVLQGYVS